MTGSHVPAELRSQDIHESNPIYGDTTATRMAVMPGHWNETNITWHHRRVPRFSSKCYALCSFRQNIPAQLMSLCLFGHQKPAQLVSLHSLGQLRCWTTQLQSLMLHGIQLTAQPWPSHPFGQHWASHLGSLYSAQLSASLLHSQTLFRNYFPRQLKYHTK